MGADVIFAGLFLALSGAAFLVYLVNRKRRGIEHLIQSGDPQQIEAGRDLVTPQLVPHLMQKYWQAQAWDEKRAIVELLQDQTHPDLPKLMLDFLRAPLEPGDEPTELAQAIALGFIDERYERFTEYYNDRDLLANDVRAVLAEHGLRSETPPPPPAPKPQPVAAPLQAVSPNQRLIDGITANSLAEVRQALGQQADVNLVLTKGNHTGCSALVYAVALKRFEIAQFLIEQGADIHYTRPDLQGKAHPGRGQSALWWAANHGHLPLAQELIRRGVQVNTPDHFNDTPLTTAASAGYLAMVRLLVENGADLQARLSTNLPGGASDGRKAIHLAVREGHLEVVEYLLNQGCDPNEPGGSGYTPLMVAVENNFYALAELLIARGADVNARHGGRGSYIALRGMTPLAFSVSAGLVRMSKLLIQSGADVHYRVPAGKRWDGKPLPARSMLDLATGKRAESLKKLLASYGVQGQE